MAGIQLKIQDVRFRQKLNDFYERHQKSSSEIMRAQARLLARDLAFQTQPFGKSPDAKRMGEMAVEREIRRVYKSAGEVALSSNLSYAIKNSALGGNRFNRSTGMPEESSTQNADQAGRAFVFLVSRGKYAEARKLLERVGVSEAEISSVPIGKMDGGQAHQTARYGARRKVPKNQLPLRIVGDRQIKTYVNKIRKNVGIAKAGWAACSRILKDTRGIPQWVTRNIGRAMGGDVVDASLIKKTPKIVIINNVPWISQCLSLSQISQSVQIQYEKMIKAIDKAMRAEAKAVGL